MQKLILWKAKWAAHNHSLSPIRSSPYSGRQRFLPDIATVRNVLLHACLLSPLLRVLLVCAAEIDVR